jgi:response regulator of citrate/malate metabolism
MILALAITFLKTVNAKEEKEKTKPGGISNQTFRRIFRNFNFFETHIRPGALT